jgi:hypothetical protein
MYKGVKEQPRTGQKNNLDGRHITCTVTYTCSITQRTSYINLHTSGGTGPSPMLRSGPQIMCILCMQIKVFHLEKLEEKL